jgi:mevalonate kinase
MYFDSSIPQGYGVGSSGALVAAIYDKYAHNKITVLEIYKRKIRIKNIFLNGVFPYKAWLRPLNSYLSIPILISKDNIEATNSNQSFDGKALSFIRLLWEKRLQWLISWKT